MRRGGAMGQGAMSSLQLGAKDVSDVAPEIDISKIRQEALNQKKSKFLPAAKKGFLSFMEDALTSPVGQRGIRSLTEAVTGQVIEPQRAEEIYGAAGRPAAEIAPERIGIGERFREFGSAQAQISQSMINTAFGRLIDEVGSWRTTQELKRKLGAYYMGLSPEEKQKWNNLGGDIG